MKKPSRNEPCWCGSGKKYKTCHLKKDQTAARRGGNRSRTTILKTPEQIAGIRKSGQLTREILDMLEERVQPGITTNQINEWVHEHTIKHGAYPAPLNYRGFPKSVCTSINNVICHGIPDDTVLQDGDIINIDVTCILDGYYGDASRMYLIGDVSEEARKLVQVTRECLNLGISQVKPNNFIGDIGHAIQRHAEGHGYSVVRDFAGHGTGIEFHEDPQIPHYGSPKTGPIIVPGMVFTIEPMINMGSWESKVLKDRWTAVTVDGSLSAQWEHTLAVTEQGVELMTG